MLNLKTTRGMRSRRINKSYQIYSLMLSRGYPDEDYQRIDSVTVSQFNLSQQ